MPHRDMEPDPMKNTYVPTPSDDARDEATRAVQIALDRRDNGGAAGK
jgi:hypothetical protein